MSEKIVRVFRGGNTKQGAKVEKRQDMSREKRRHPRPESSGHEGSSKEEKNEAEGEVKIEEDKIEKNFGVKAKPDSLKEIQRELNEQIMNNEVRFKVLKVVEGKKDEETGEIKRFDIQTQLLKLDEDGYYSQEDVPGKKEKWIIKQYVSNYKKDTKSKEEFKDSYERWKEREGNIIIAKVKPIEDKSQLEKLVILDHETAEDLKVDCLEEFNRGKSSKFVEQARKQFDANDLSREVLRIITKFHKDEIKRLEKEIFDYNDQKNDEIDKKKEENEKKLAEMKEEHDKKNEIQKKEYDRRREEVLEKEKELEVKSKELKDKEKEVEKREKILKERKDIHKKEVERLNEDVKLLFAAIKESIRCKQEKEVPKKQLELKKRPNKTISKDIQALIYNNSNSNYPLIYDESTIEVFLRCLQSNKLTILSGPSGTGKTSLVNGFANSIEGAIATVIPVQPSWTDKEDLLGYFNPKERRYEPTRFMEALLDARDDEEHLHIICLDEMNLAHVEYYFAEFLSALETDSEISLYDKRYEEEAYNRIHQSRSLEETEEIGETDAERLISDYPARFEIPKNIRFIGTINMDHTTKPLSHKVIDRVYVVEIGHFSDNEKKAKEESIIEHLKVIKSEKNIDGETLNYEIVLQMSFFEPASKENEELSKRILDKISSDTKDLTWIPNVEISERGKKQIKDYISFLDSRDEVEIKELVDNLLCIKLLPRISVSRNNKTQVDCLREWCDKVKKEEYKRTCEKLTKMIGEEEERKPVIQFWRY